MKKFDFNGLFICDLANNHQGDLKHGLNIVKAMGKVAKSTGVRGALKFQFRQLDTFIHSDFKDNKELPHISRFMSTRLCKEDFKKLADEVRRQNMITIATAFDEESVDMILDLDIEVIKVASCSATDQPLLEKIVETNRPVIISTAGLTLNQVDRLVSFLDHRRTNFALMHCVALYPTPNEKLRLNQIELLKSRFPDVSIGFSTHENPDNYSAIQIAFAKGARLFEKHVGLKTKKYKLNAYSSTPEQIESWIKAYFNATAASAGAERAPSFPEEIASLSSLKRGIFAKRKIKKGDIIKRENVFFAMPLLKGQLASGEWSRGLKSDKSYSPGEAIDAKLIKLEVSNDELVYQIMLQVRGMLNKARIFISPDSSFEISHHYGLERFREFGAVIVNCINRVYSKKLVIMLPRQKHPYHYHKKKEETFQLLCGDLEVELEGNKMKLECGETLLIKPNQWHKFHTLDGAIFEEVATTHYNDDSFYEDTMISRISREKRKTQIPNWESTVKD